MTVQGLVVVNTMRHRTKQADRGGALMHRCHVVFEGFMMTTTSVIQWQEAVKGPKHC